MIIRQVTPETFAVTFDFARQGALVSDMTSPYDELSTPGAAYLLYDGLYAVGGFVVNDGEITHLFAIQRGLGGILVHAAKERGGNRLDCFDGYLPGFYAGHGFVETAREPNWTPGGPDVVWMNLAS